MTPRPSRLGMLLKGYPRISESFISSEILLLEQLGIPIEIYSLKQPRESFSHDNVKDIQAPVTYLPEYVLPNLSTLARANAGLARNLSGHYWRCLGQAYRRAWQRRSTATIRHFLQAGYLAHVRLNNGSVPHIHAHFCHTPASVALFASDLTGIPFSFTAHAKDIYTSEPDQLRRKISQARFVVTCTRYNARHLERYADDGTPIYTVYHGIDLDYFKYDPVPPPEPPYRLLSVGRLVPKKGYDDLLTALKILKDAGHDYVFTHIGSGEQEHEVKTMTAKLGLQQNVRFLGTQPHEVVLEHYRQAHCFVLACKIASDGDRDGIPNVLVEAMAVGVPVISTKISAIPELVEDGVNGCLVEPGKPQALALALTRTLLNWENSSTWLPDARTTVERSFDNKRCIQQLHDIFRQTLPLESR